MSSKTKKVRNHHFVWLHEQAMKQERPQRTGASRKERDEEQELTSKDKSLISENNKKIQNNFKNIC